MVGWPIAVHGGAGVDPNPTERQEQAKQFRARCLHLDRSAHRLSASAIDVVELVPCRFGTENGSDIQFGAWTCTDGERNGRDGSIVDGLGRRCGAVSGLTTVKNAIKLDYVLI